jgi:hypothetical protein
MLPESPNGTILGSFKALDFEAPALSFPATFMRRFVLSTPKNTQFE